MGERINLVGGYDNTIGGVAPIRVEIHRTDTGEYVIADGAGWVPGVYATIADAVQGWLRESGESQ